MKNRFYSITFNRNNHGSKTPSIPELALQTLRPDNQQILLQNFATAFHFCSFTCDQIIYFISLYTIIYCIKLKQILPSTLYNHVSGLSPIHTLSRLLSPTREYIERGVRLDMPTYTHTDKIDTMLSRGGLKGICNQTLTGKTENASEHDWKYMDIQKESITDRTAKNWTRYLQESIDKPINQ